jgi:hypothetical protein
VGGKVRESAATVERSQERTEKMGEERVRTATVGGVGRGAVLVHVRIGTTNIASFPNNRKVLLGRRHSCKNGNELLSVFDFET